MIGTLVQMASTQWNTKTSESVFWKYNPECSCTNRSKKASSLQVASLRHLINRKIRGGGSKMAAVRQWWHQFQVISRHCSILWNSEEILLHVLKFVQVLFSVIMCFKSYMVKALQLIPIPIYCGRHGGLIVSALDSGASGPGSSPGRRHCVVFLGKTLPSHSAFLHPGV